MFNVKLKIISQKGHCVFGHKLGDEWTVGSNTEKIIELKGEDYASIINQLPKFEISSYQENSLDTEDVEKIVTGIEPHSIWDLTEAIENEDISKYLIVIIYQGS